MIKNCPHGKISRYLACVFLWFIVHSFVLFNSRSVQVENSPCLLNFRILKLDNVQLYVLCCTLLYCICCIFRYSLLKTIMARLTIRCIAFRSSFIMMFVLMIYSVYRLQHNPAGTLLHVNDLNECASNGICTSSIATRLEVSPVDSVSRLFSALSDPLEPTPRVVQRLLKNADNNNYDMDRYETDVSEHNLETAVSTSQEGAKEHLKSRGLISENIVVQGLNCSDNRDCLPPLLRADGVIRHCITGNIIGKVSPDLKTSPVRLGKAKIAESAPVRQRSFKQVFDSRAWGHSWDAQFKGLNASGVT